jgi:transposase InsO family protein
MGKIRKPTTQGKIERWHGSVLEEAHLPPKGSSAEDYRRSVLEYVEFYNNSRPHHGIGLQIPMVVYAAGLIFPEVFTALGVHEVP